jgi:hypothetical protein
MTAPNCLTCDRREATDHEWRDFHPGERPDLCWGPDGDCRDHAVDWRARALAAEADAAESAATRDRMRDILDSIATALRGKPRENGTWGWADLPVHMARVLRERDEARKIATLAVRCHLSPSDDVRREGFREAMKAVDGWEVE